MNALLRDLRYGARMIRKTPAASIIAVIALALGLGLTTLMFSIVYGAMLRSLPFEESEELILLSRTKPSAGIENMGPTVHDYADWRGQQQSFEELGAYYSTAVTLSLGESPVLISAAHFSATLFRVLGVAPMMGRAFTEEDDRPGSPPVVLLGWDAWQTHFGGDPDIVGRSTRVNAEEAVIVGIMPRGFGFPNVQSVWLPLRADPGREPRGRGRGLNVIGRLRDHVSLASASAEFDRIAARLAAEFPATNQDTGVRLREFDAQRLGVEERTVLWTMLGAVVFVLLIACANVANLLIGRAMVRTREIGVRTALGASRWRIVSQFLAESFALSLAGALVGTALAGFGLRAFNAAIVDSEPPYWLSIQLDAPALLWTFAAMLLATIAAGVIPAVQAARTNTHDVLKDESRGSSSFRLGRLSRVLVMAEMAMSVGLLVGAGLMIKSVVRLHTVDVGYDAKQVFSARVAITPAGGEPASTERRLQFAHDVLTPLQNSAGVLGATLASTVPGLNPGRNLFAIEGRSYLAENDYPAAPTNTVWPGFFAFLGHSPLAGREFTLQDRDGSLPVALVNRSFEQRHFPGESAIGKRIRMGGANSPAPWMTIVGVVPDLSASGFEGEEPAGIYRALPQSPPTTLVILARTRGEPAALAPDVRGIIRAINPDLALSDAGSVYDRIQDEGWYFSVFGTLFVAFGLAALFLASLGLYGVMAFSVSRRRREIGVRLAVGANTRDVVSLVFRQGMTQTAIGLALGAAFALLVSRLMAAILFDVEPRDPAIFALILTVLLATAGLACWLPARRAARTDPLEAIRYD